MCGLIMVSKYSRQIELLVNGHPPIVLSATTEGAYANRVELTVKGSVPGEGLDIPVNTVFVHREQILENEGLHDILQIQNFHREKAHLVIEITYDCRKKHPYVTSWFLSRGVARVQPKAAL
jgi:hypothetical protein